MNANEKKGSVVMKCTLDVSVVGFGDGGEGM